MKVSIIIPTYRDWDRLRLCLSALEEQTYPQEDFEIIVIDNDYHDANSTIIKFPKNCTLIKEKKKGSYAARNAGINVSKGEIIGFTDSDCIPDINWIKYAVEYLESNLKCKRLAGSVNLFYKSEKLSLTELYEKYYAFNQNANVRNGVSVTANMFTYKNLFTDYVGYFNINLLSGGDFEWNKRASQCGLSIEYSDRVKVMHPARHQISELIKKYKRTAGGIKATKIKALQRSFKSLIPPYRLIIYFLLKEKNSRKDLVDKIKVVCLGYCLSIIHNLEILKISFGKESNRT